MSDEDTLGTPEFQWPEQLTELDVLIQQLISDPEDPRTELHQFENGWTEYVTSEDERVASTTRIIERCLTGTCYPQELAHAIDCKTRGSEVR